MWDFFRDTGGFGGKEATVGKEGGDNAKSAEWEYAGGAKCANGGEDDPNRGANFG